MLEVPSPTLLEVAFEMRRYLIDELPYDCQRQAFKDNEMTLYPALWRDFLKQKYSLCNSLEDNFYLFLDNIIHSSTVQITLGKRGAGKTALLMSLAEEYHNKGYYVACYNCSKDLPKWCNHHKYDEKKPYYDVPRHSFIIHDEIHLDIDSKNWQSVGCKCWRHWASTSRHRNQTINCTSQLASNISLDMMKYADILLFKAMNQQNSDIDRADFLKPYSFFYPKTKNEFLGVLDGKIFYGLNNLPKFYNKKISEAIS